MARSLRLLCRLCLLPVLAAVTGCVSRPDAHVPPFARVPYEPVSREAIVAIALREWRLFGSPMADEGAAASSAKPPEQLERGEGLWQRVGEYWWLGLDRGAREGRWTGKHDEQGHVFSPDRDGDYPWSAAFVSYVMRIAGAGPHFPYAPDHAHYIDIAKRQALGKESDWLVIAERPEDYAPQPGDLVCRGRDSASELRFDDLPVGHYFPAHCDIVVDTSVPGVVAIIGGNDRDAVTMEHEPVAADGKLTTPGLWLVVLRLEIAGR